MNETLENWGFAGMIMGRAFAEETQKLAAIYLLDEQAKAGVLTKEAAGNLLKMVTKSPAFKRIGIPAAALAAGAGGGAVIAQKKERQRAQEEVEVMAPQVFRAGFMQGARQGFVQGAQKGYAMAQQEGSQAG